MKKVKIKVKHIIEQEVFLDLPDDELKDMCYADAICNCEFNECDPYTVKENVIVGTTVDGKSHYFS